MRPATTPRLTGWLVAVRGCNSSTWTKARCRSKAVAPQHLFITRLIATPATGGLLPYYPSTRLQRLDSASNPGVPQPACMSGPPLSVSSYERVGRVVLAASAATVAATSASAQASSHIQPADEYCASALRQRSFRIRLRLKVLCLSRASSASKHRPQGSAVAVASEQHPHT